MQDYENSVARVLRDLRPWKYDPTVPKLFRLRRLSFTNYWDLDDWSLYTSRKRYLRYVFGLPKSRLIRRILPQLVILAVWSGMASALAFTRKGIFDRLRIPLTSLSLVSTFVAALQTLRSNQGLGRLSEARLAMGDMVHYTRDTATLISTYFGRTDECSERLRLKAARLLALFGWSLKQHLRQTASTDDVYEALLIPHHSTDAKYIMGERKVPVAIIHRLRSIIAYAVKRGIISSNEHRLLEQNLQGLDKVVATGDRIRSTPIPPVYGAHASRLMVFYLAFLPMALLNVMSFQGTIEVTMIVGFAMLGLDEISHLFEQPFRFMPLYQLAKVSMMDVADAFCRPPPPLGSESTVEDATVKIPAYWAIEGDARLPYDTRLAT